MNLTFQLRLANAMEAECIANRLRALGRQTMNYRSSTSAKFITLWLGTLGIGWAGFDFNSSSGYPEFFSLYVEDGWRGWALGQMLELARSHQAAKAGFDFVYLRMTAEHTAPLLNARINSGIYRRIQQSELQDDFLSRCLDCELYGDTCVTQEYLELNVQRSIALGRLKFPGLDLSKLPVSINNDFVRPIFNVPANVGAMQL